MMARRRWLAWAGILAATHVLSACGQLCLNPQPEPPGNDCDKDNATRGGSGGSTGGAGGSGGMTTSDASVGIDGGGPIISSDGGVRSDVSTDAGDSGEAGSDAGDPSDDATSDTNEEAYEDARDTSPETPDVAEDSPGSSDTTDEEIRDGVAPDPDAPATDSSASVQGGNAPRR